MRSQRLPLRQRLSKGLGRADGVQPRNGGLCWRRAVLALRSWSLPDGERPVGVPRVLAGIVLRRGRVGRAAVPVWPLREWNDGRAQSVDDERGRLPFLPGRPILHHRRHRAGQVQPRHGAAGRGPGLLQALHGRALPGRTWRDRVPRVHGRCLPRRGRCRPHCRALRAPSATLPASHPSASASTARRATFASPAPWRSPSAARARMHRRPEASCARLVEGTFQGEEARRRARSAATASAALRVRRSPSRPLAPPGPTWTASWRPQSMSRRTLAPAASTAAGAPAAPRLRGCARAADTAEPTRRSPPTARLAATAAWRGCPMQRARASARAATFARRAA